MSRVRLLLWPTIVAVPGVVLLAGLGTWQVERLKWKAALIAEREARLAHAVATLDEMHESAGDLNFRRVAVRGEYLHDQEFHLLSRTSKGRAGIHVVTPFMPRPALSGFQVILINRGWVPNELISPQRRRAGQIEGVVDVAGIVRTDSKRRGWFTPENDPTAGVWHHVDIEQMADVLGSTAAPFIVEADASPIPGGYPVGGQTRTKLRNDHLEYAITWYTLAAALVIIYLAFAVREVKRHSKEHR